MPFVNLSSLSGLLKTVSGFALGLAALFGIPLGLLAWAEGTFQTKEEAVRAEMAAGVFHTRQQAAQSLDYFSAREDVIWLELRYLSERPPSLLSPMDKLRLEELQGSLRVYKDRKQQALETLK